MNRNVLCSTFFVFISTFGDSGVESYWRPLAFIILSLILSNSTCVINFDFNISVDVEVDNQRLLVGRHLFLVPTLFPPHR